MLKIFYNAYSDKKPELLDRIIEYQDSNILKIEEVRNLNVIRTLVYSDYFFRGKSRDNKFRKNGYGYVKKQFKRGRGKYKEANQK